MIFAVGDSIIWGISGTTSGGYCQQWTAISGASCICDAVFPAVLSGYTVVCEKEVSAIECAIEGVLRNVANPYAVVQSLFRESSFRVANDFL